MKICHPAAPRLGASSPAEPAATPITPSRRIRAVLSALLAGLCAMALAPAQAQAPQTQLPHTRIQAGMHLIDAQVALTPEQRSIGLMWRQELPSNEGMLFVFERAATQCFWMKNTLLPLTAAFVADDGTIVNLADMQPRSEDSHCSTQPVRFVLEMRQGWFARRGLAAGQKLAGAAFQPAQPRP